MCETIPGTLSVSNDVIADIAGYAAMSCYGVVGMAEQLQGAESVRLLPGQRLRKGVMVSSTEDGLVVDLHVVLENGVNMKSVCANLTRLPRSTRLTSRSPFTSMPLSPAANPLLVRRFTQYDCQYHPHLLSHCRESGSR